MYNKKHFRMDFSMYDIMRFKNIKELYIPTKSVAFL